MEQPSLCFIIACKLYRQYPIYLEHYVSNIQKFYPSALTILVDNNSSYNEYYERFMDMKNVVCIENTSESKFELGAYKFATEYIKQNTLNFDYYVCTQDTFILVNKYDFNTLVANGTKACALSHFHFNKSNNYHKHVLSQLNLYDPNEEFLCCWCSSWCCDHESLLSINTLLNSIVPVIRYHSEQTERYMGKILKLLNNNVSASIETEIECNNYNCHSIDPTSEEAKQYGNYFIKHAQQKNENTLNLI